MVIIDGSFLLGIAAVLSSLGTLWRIARNGPASALPCCEECSRKHNEREICHASRRNTSGCRRSLDGSGS